MPFDMQNESDFLDKIRANQGIILKLVQLYARNREDSKDLYQEILLQAWKAFPKFRGDSKFSTWLYRVSLNTILTAQRRPQLMEYRDSIDESLASVGAKGIEAEKQQALRQAIRQLAETDRAIISLHLDGFTNSEIADILGISVNNTGVKLHRIKSLLTQKLQPA